MTAITSHGTPVCLETFSYLARFAWIFAAWALISVLRVNLARFHRSRLFIGRPPAHAKAPPR
ncbi:Uncharacterised protein [Mycobacterium tuberculosis]|nr:Uncharacterised protein [Mycobacterium tuberculosis]